MLVGVQTPQGGSLTRFHRRIAEAGVGLTTIAYWGAAEADGRINENRLYMHERIREPLMGLIRTLHSRMRFALEVLESVRRAVGVGPGPAL